MNVGDHGIVFRKTEGRLQIPVAAGIILLLWVVGSMFLLAPPE